MTANQIKKQIKQAKNNIIIAQHNLEDAYTALKRIQVLCPHTNINSWTNDDGGGQFKVERCLDCGLQEDGGLKR